MDNYLDRRLEFDEDGKLYTWLYDKRDDFDLPIVNFPYLNSKIPESPEYYVFVSQLTRYARVCSKYVDFLFRGSILVSKLLRQGYSSWKLKTTFRKFYCHHTDIVHKLYTSVSHMLKGLWHIIGFQLWSESWRVPHVGQEILTICRIPDIILFEEVMSSPIHYMYITEFVSLGTMFMDKWLWFVCLA